MPRFRSRPPVPPGLLDRHLEFLAALRKAGLSVSLAEGLDAVAGLGRVGWGERETVRAVYAATLVKRHDHRTTFDTVFDLWFPALVGDGVGDEGLDHPDHLDHGPDRIDLDQQALHRRRQDGPEALAEYQSRLEAALAAADDPELGRLAVEGTARFGAMPGRGEGMSSWSAHQAMNRIRPGELADRIAAALVAAGEDTERAETLTASRIADFTRRVEDDARRRIAEQKGPEHVADVTVRPSIDRLDFLAARRTDLDEMRRLLYPLSRRLATRLAQEQHARRRGPLDFRRTVRASLSTGGVPLTTHHRPRRPHRTELVVLCDVSGSVAHFASFTLLLVHALREQFSKVRAFTFIDHVHEVTDHFRPGRDIVETMEELSASTAHAALWGRTNYGRAFTKFAELHADALGPRTSLLILGDARSNWSDLGLDALTTIKAQTRHAWWLNPEARRNWDTGDSAATAYGEVVPMVECRNLTQLTDFVHDIV
ncbi:vWA domain-containing protein [Nocardioides limicola]|uniref:vWA domain-containing protein n=1 Tax=Nocardioides limicola TaxID=2803368 RepID=UPI00193B6D5D|nr:VWA domain-containing protein [Nocardioides sp. DJM-14]